MSNTQTNDVSRLEDRLDLAGTASARMMELMVALRPYIDESSFIELPMLLFNRMNQLCHVVYDATGGGDLGLPGHSLADLQKIIDANDLTTGEKSS